MTEKVDRPVHGVDTPREGAVNQPLERLPDREANRQEELGGLRGRQAFYDPERGPANKHS